MERSDAARPVLQSGTAWPGLLEPGSVGTERVDVGDDPVRPKTPLCSDASSSSSCGAAERPASVSNCRTEVSSQRGGLCSPV